MTTKDPEIKVVVSESLCMEIITAAGILHAFATKSTETRKAAIFRHDYDDEPHTCLAVLHTGYAVASDNGFVVAMIPERTAPRDEARKFLLEFMADVTGKPVIVQPMERPNRMNS